MARSLITLASGIFNSIVWTWLASLVVSPAYAVTIGIVAGLATILVMAALQIGREADNLARSTVGETPVPMKRDQRAYSPEVW